MSKGLVSVMGRPEEGIRRNVSTRKGDARGLWARP